MSAPVNIARITGYATMTALFPLLRAWLVAGSSEVFQIDNAVTGQTNDSFVIKPRDAALTFQIAFVRRDINTAWVGVDGAAAITAVGGANVEPTGPNARRTPWAINFYIYSGGGALSTSLEIVEYEDHLYFIAGVTGATYRVTVAGRGLVGYNEAPSGHIAGSLFGITGSNLHAEAGTDGTQAQNWNACYHASASGGSDHGAGKAPGPVRVYVNSPNKDVGFLKNFGVLFPAKSNGSTVAHGTGDAKTRYIHLVESGAGSYVLHWNAEGTRNNLP